MALIIAVGYMFIALYILNDFRKGLKVHKATFSYWHLGFIPRFTVRERNGRFKRNKVGVWYVATH